MAAVNPKEWTHVSWSQVEVYRLCKRRWWFTKHRPDIKEEPSPDLDLGTAAHEVMEAHYTPDMKVSDWARGILEQFPITLASTEKMRQHPELPPVGGDLRVEYPKDYQLGYRIAGVSVKGRCDILWGKTPVHLSIGDWKTVGSKVSEKTPDTLERFGQPIIYAAWAFTAMPHLETVDFFHGQIFKKKIDAKIVQTRPLDRDHVFGILPSIERTVEEMKLDYVATDPSQVTATVGRSTCHAFNRACPYTEVCPKSLYAGLDRLNPPTTTTGVPAMSLEEKLKRNRQATTTTQPPAAGPAQPLTVVRAEGINPPDAAKPDTSKAGSYTPPPVEAVTSATPPPVTATGKLTAKLVLEIEGKRYEVVLPVSATEAP